MKNLFFLIFIALSSVSYSDIINVPAEQATIQAGINAASNGDTVLVANGNYLENINYKGKAITVASHYIIDTLTSHISNTIIDGSNPSHPDSGSVVTFESGEDTTSVLMGFTITGGSGTITELIWLGELLTPRAGGGVFCYESGAYIAYNKIIENHIENYPQAYAAGIEALPTNSDAYIIVKNNEIMYNSVIGDEDVGPSAVSFSCNGELLDNIISYNTVNANDFAYGAVLFFSEPNVLRNVLVKNNRITHNTTSVTGDFVLNGGLTIESGTSAIITGNTIAYNETYGYHCQSTGLYINQSTAFQHIDRNIIFKNKSYGNITRGGGIGVQGSVTYSTLITNNKIYDNVAQFGAGIAKYSTTVQIINNTIVNNIAEQGGGIYGTGRIPGTGSTSVFINNIIWGNKTRDNTQILGFFGSDIITHYSNVQGGATGIGNIDSDPLFADTLFNLSEFSPSVGTAIIELEIDGNVYYSPENDYDANTRPNSIDNFVDMGARESSFAVKAYPINTTFPDKYVALNSELNIKTGVFNPNNKNISVYAKIISSDSIVIDSTELYDDGEHNDENAADGLYGANINLTDQETIYRTGIGIYYNTGDKYVYFNDTTKFTTLQVKYTDYTAEIGGFDSSRYELSLSLKNESNSTVKGLSITLELISDDSCSSVVGSTSEFDDLGPGQTAESNEKYIVNLLECQDKNIPLIFRIDIKVNGYLFWQDTLAIIATDLEDTELNLPKEFALRQNYPNPFNPKTMINYQLAMNSDVDLSIYNLLGQKVATLVAKKQTAGSYSVEWDATGFASGVYLYRLESDPSTSSGRRFVQTKKLLLLK